MATRLFSAFLISSLYAGHTNFEHFLKIKLQIHGDIGFQNSQKITPGYKRFGKSSNRDSFRKRDRANPLRAISNNTKYKYILYTPSTTVSVPSYELGPPTPSPAIECAPPLKSMGEGTHSLLGEGVGIPIRTTEETA